MSGRGAIDSGILEQSAMGQWCWHVVEAIGKTVLLTVMGWCGQLGIGIVVTLVERLAQV